MSTPTTTDATGPAACANPWHTTSPGRMSILCPECPGAMGCEGDVCENPRRYGNPNGHTSSTCYPRYLEFWEPGADCMSKAEWLDAGNARP